MMCAREPSPPRHEPTSARGALPDSEAHLATHVTLHIGVPKTGTTALQHALARHSAALASAGVAYPVADGRKDHSGEVADLKLALTTTGTPNHAGYARLLRTARPGSWEPLVQRVRSIEGRALISNEALSGLPAPIPARIINELTDDQPENARVVLVVRPLSTLLPSSYGQMARDRLVPSFEFWAKAWLHTKIRQIAAPRMDDWTDGFLVARNWGANGAEVICVQYSSDGDEYLTAALAALGLSGVRDEISLTRANPSMSALGLMAWQGLLRTGIDPLDPATNRFRKRLMAEIPELGQDSTASTFRLAPDVAALVDAAFPQPSPGVVSASNASPAYPDEVRAAIIRLSERLQQSQPLTVDSLADRGPEIATLADLIIERYHGR